MRLKMFLSGASALTLCAGVAVAQSDTQIIAPDVSVAGDAASVDVTAVESQDTSYAMSGEAYALSGAAGGTNVLRAVSLLPGVNSPAIDPYGMASLIGSNKGIRIRGELNMHGNGGGAVEGLAIMGVNPGPGNLFLLDQENVETVQLHQGAVAPDHAATFTSYGVINTRLKWPTAKAGADLSQSIGENSFYRSALRADSGDLGTDYGHLKLFASASWARADKWRGTGHAPDGKHTLAFGLQSDPVSNLSAKLFVAYGDMKQDVYRGLSYDQVSDLDANRDLDFSASSSATATDGVLYQGYNRQDFTDWLLISEFIYTPSDKLRLSLKPFYQHERGFALTGMSSGMIRDWLISHDAYGFTAGASARLIGIDWRLGYSWSSQTLPGPPSAWKMYKPQADGSMKFAKWAILGKERGRHQMRNLYLVADKQIGRIDVTVGGRYVWQKVPGIDAYDTTGLTDTDYKSALKASSGVLSDRSVNSIHMGGFLPFAALRYALTDDLSFKISSGRNYGATVFEVWPSFQQKYSSYAALGYTADQLWQKMRPETSVSTDISLHWNFSGRLGQGYVEPLLFYSNFRHKSVSYNAGIGISYAQNVARTHSSGMQLSAHYLPVPQVDIFTSVNYTRNVFGANLPTLSSASDSVKSAVAVEGKQLPDVPLWSGALGLTWQYHDFSLTPVLQMVGPRYGDSAHMEKVAGYGILDLSASYLWKLPFGEMTTSLSVSNIFDKAYVGLISASYYQASSASGSYFPGAPRTVWGKVGFSL